MSKENAVIQNVGTEHGRLVLLALLALKQLSDNLDNGCWLQHPPNFQLVRMCSGVLAWFPRHDPFWPVDFFVLCLSDYKCDESAEKPEQRLGMTG